MHIGFDFHLVLGPLCAFFEMHTTHIFTFMSLLFFPYDIQWVFHLHFLSIFFVWQQTITCKFQLIKIILQPI
jgi:hypothetical protein